MKVRVPLFVLVCLVNQVMSAPPDPACFSTKPTCPNSNCNDECDGGYSCQSMAKTYGCADVVTFGNCIGKCDCTCPPGAPVPAPTTAKTGSCTGKTAAPCYSELAQWQIDSVLARHNELRALHGACPLTYDDEIAAYSKTSPGFKTTCTMRDLTHNDPPQYSKGRLGENLAMVGAIVDLHNWDPAEGVGNWYCKEENCWDYNTNTESGVTGHMTAVVWKATTKVGCALCHVADGSFIENYLICNYETGGNVGDMGIDGYYKANVGRYGETAMGCNDSPTGNNECDAMPCGTGQTCADPDDTKDNDYTCTCDSDPTIVATGGQPTCETDECDAMPCGSGQDCNDPNSSSNSLHDFVCSCQSDPMITKTDGPATCSKNECDSDPCGGMQTCNDPGPTLASLKDYICTCPNGVQATGAQATCEVNECDSSPCGPDQVCDDPDQAANKLHDFTCSCMSDPSIKQVDGPATCSKNECDTNPCDASQSQTCSDPNPTVASLKDYICECPNGVQTTGTAVPSCETDECDASPCGMDQDCNDPDTAANKLHDFVCSCMSDPSIKRVDGPATCTANECDSDPCDGTQMQVCNDPNPSLSSNGDYTCTCPNGVMATGGAVMKCEDDECAAPCDASQMQTCTDPDPTFASIFDLKD
eukprot:TRINITY_DN753_c0_g1_i11.p1 TRINITY_DN753_c0_g1~~TRINITY_DN753_c0_g1_i11.p1  ORF type:complete len:655 (+),score=159.38 TRINITY_DN753_c0_g1_i11:32-1966(+)